MEEFETNAGDKLWVHNAMDCHGPVCPIHAPTPHHMREWKMIWRGDRGIFERLCPEHGTGHPDPDDMEAQQLIKGWADGIHGCCLCCAHGRIGDYVQAKAYHGEYQIRGTLQRTALENYPPTFIYHVVDNAGAKYRIVFSTAVKIQAPEYTMVDLDPERQDLLEW